MREFDKRHGMGLGWRLLLSRLSCLQMLIIFQNPTKLLTERDCNMSLQIPLIISSTVYCTCSLGDIGGFLIVLPLKGVEFTLKFLILGSAEFTVIIHNQLTSEDFCWFGYIFSFAVYDNYICNRINNKQYSFFPPRQLTISILAPEGFQEGERTSQQPLHNF